MRVDRMVAWQTHGEYVVGWDELFRSGIGLAPPPTVAGPCDFFGRVGEGIGWHTWKVLEHYDAKVASTPLVGVNNRDSPTDSS